MPITKRSFWRIWLHGKRRGERIGRIAASRFHGRRAHNRALSEGRLTPGLAKPFRRG